MEKINIAELLKDCPKDMELDCTIYEDVYFDKVNDEDCFYRIACYTLINGVKNSLYFSEFGEFSSYKTAKCVIFPKGKTTWEGFVPPCKFEDGDIVVADDGVLTQMFILKEVKCHKNDGYNGDCYFGWDFAYNELFHEGIWEFNRLATEEEKQKLFDAIKANGYKWNPETKTLEKKKEYPTTYEECIGKLSINWDGKTEGYKSELLNNFQKLLICRGTYWKIAGEEMGLGKSWEPDYTNPNEKRFAIHSYVVRGEDGVYRLIPVYSKIGEMRDALGERHILEFPTEEMRDAFYENFKDLINRCKELL